ncbi:DUF881 domain-containing protein [Desulfoscipio geothermicus]|uniref:Uncharacterized conserved protein YlxW, UPF0749 family n=1 Tax=Desulfoscipio geothermicus DSM 3669 TaxID=1121426 RepID=A0A1I6EDG1_9FIRM|nr:DUF881 domain-containing protein [Desulfoscipio geothermicus]SFR15790.1 Uncharacterized conserved protein YlxW, UPF0749 family [Desulfoscipio geothermicus DSM 3669]
MSQRTTVYISIMLVAAILGIMLAVQFRVVNRSPGGISANRAEELLTDLKQINREQENLKKEIADLNYKLNQVNKGKSEAIEALRGELNKVRMSAGLVTVTGPGVEVVLDNPKNETEPGMPPGLFIIRDEDLLKVVNELWGAGAEAISINGQRIIATSEIRLAAPFININTRRVVPPYQVLAVGNPDTLVSSLELPGGLVEYLRSLGIDITVEKHDDLTIPAYAER